MSQMKYVLDIPQDTDLIRARLEKFTMEQNLKLFLIEGEKLIDRLIYLTVTRPDIVLVFFEFSIDR